MPRLTSPTGVVVNVSDEKAAQLAAIGYQPASDDSDRQAPAKKTAERKPAAKK